MVADALTKSLPAPAHAKHRDVMLGRVPFCVRTMRPSNCVMGGCFSLDRGSLLSLVCPFSLHICDIRARGRAILSGSIAYGEGFKGRFRALKHFLGERA
jgi:hypothetical protein